jgi:glycine dehydrogenase subunit 2
MSIKKVRSNISPNEALLFERSSPGKKAYQLPVLDVPAVDPRTALGEQNVRAGIEGFPEVSEVEVIRHFTRLSTWNYAIDYGMYPLGSCTMKYNPRVNELVARTEGLAWAHPYQPESLSQGVMEIMAHLESALLEITGMDAVTLQPAAGAQGELTGILLIRALLAQRGNPRKKILIPDSAHGTNPATAAIAGYVVENIRSDEHGLLDLAALEKSVTEDVAGLMVTNPNTLGVFESRIIAAAEVLHRKGALLYMDGANMNALVGIARPGDFGVDVMHLNLHKTFSTPHGGGGPGGGPVAVKKELEPFLPVPRLKRAGERWSFDYDRPLSIGKVKAFYGLHPGARRQRIARRHHGCRAQRQLYPQEAGTVLRPALHAAQHARSGFQRRAPGAPGRAHGRYRQAPDRLWIPSVHRQLPVDRARRHDDRAHRDRRQAGAGPLHRRHDFHCQRDRNRAGDGEDRAPLDAHQPRG